MTLEVAKALLDLQRAVITSELPKARQAIVLNAAGSTIYQLERTGLLTHEEVANLAEIRDTAFIVTHGVSFPEYRYSSEVTTGGEV